MGQRGSMRKIGQTTGNGDQYANRVLLSGAVVEGPVVVHHRNDRVVLRMRIEVAEGQPSIAVTMWNPPADLALAAMTARPGCHASVHGHLEYLLDLRAQHGGELVVVADELTLERSDKTA